MHVEHWIYIQHSGGSALWNGVHCFMSMLSNYRIEENVKGSFW